MSASPDAPLVLLDAALRGILVALLLLLAGVLLRDRPRLPAARATVAMALGLCVQVIAATPLLEDSLPRLWQAPLVAVSVANAMLFWLFVQALFDDDFVLRPWHGVLWLAVAGLAGFNCAVMAGSGSVLAPVTWGLQRAIPLVFAVLAAVAAAAHWRADLVEGRRRLRGFIVVTGVAYTVVMLIARLAAPNGRLSPDTALVDVLLMLAMVAVIAWRMLRLVPTELFPSSVQVPPMAPGSQAAQIARLIGAPAGAAAAARLDADHGAGITAKIAAAALADTLADSAAVTDPAATPQPPLPPPDAAEQRLADALQRLMATDRAYRTEDLTLAALASRLAVPEYRLRRLINQRLGHRNFNAFVNGWRLDEACAALASPAQRDLPVLTIALEAGFQSIGPFNRAFKVATGLTPTEFRRQKLADC